MPSNSGFVTGRVDLLFRDDQDLVAVDYKSDEVEADACEAQAAEHYSGQAVTTCEASRVRSAGPEKVVLVFARAGVEVAMS